MNPDVLQCIEKIDGLLGMEEFKSIVKEWSHAAQNLYCMPSTARITLPNYLCATRSGVGTSTMLGLMADFLEEANLLEFVGDVKYFEFILDNDPEFSSFTRLLDTFRKAAGFRGAFKGIACIDISEWINDLKDIRFLRFLEYSAEISSTTMFVFQVPILDPKAFVEVEAVVSSYLRVRPMTIHFPQTSELILYVSSKLKENGFVLAQNAADMLAKTIAGVREMVNFDGYKTLNLLVEEILYEKCCNGVLHGNVIEAEDVIRFLPDGQWIKQLKQSKTRLNLGFVTDQGNMEVGKC
jgi:hypothetical protein